MACEVEFTDEFELWWNSLTPDEQDSVDFSVALLEEYGVYLEEAARRHHPRIEVQQHA